MQKALLLLGVLLCGIGAALLVAGAVLSYRGLGASYNFGDPAKFQFVLVPFWLIGLVVAAVGAACLIWRRRLKTPRT
jgi:hypothetical protein